MLTFRGGVDPVYPLKYGPALARWRGFFQSQFYDENISTANGVNCFGLDKVLRNTKRESDYTRQCGFKTKLEGHSVERMYLRQRCFDG